MAVQASLDYRLNTNSPAGIGIAQTNQSRWAPGAGTGGQRQTITLPASTFTAISIPSGSKALVLLLGSAVSLVLKGITGDTGVALTPSSNPLGIDAILPLGTSPSVGILNNALVSQNIEAIIL